MPTNQPLLEPSSDPDHSKRAPIAKEGLRAADAAAYVGVSTNLWRQLDARGVVPQPVELSLRLPVWPKTELRAWLLAGAPPRAKWRLMREAAISKYG